jgi:hypothetical protein
MNNLEAQIEALDDILDTAGQVKGPNFVSFCKFVLNCFAMTDFATYLADNDPVVHQFFKLTCGSMVGQYARALEISAADSKEAIDLVITIQKRFAEAGEDNGQDS